MADDPGLLLRSLAASDRRGAVWCAALCAQSVLHLVPAGEDRPRKAVELALDYGSGVEISAERMRSAAAASASASADSAASRAAYAANAANAASRAAYAANAANAAAYSAYSASYAADAYASSDAAASAAASDAAAWGRARAASLAQLAELVQSQTTPVAPTLEDVRQARPEAQVAWDWLLEHSPEPMRIGSLGEALDRARRLGLRWECPVDRALAERARDEDVVRTILTGRAA